MGLEKDLSIKKSYYPEIDFIKTFAIISVILLHILVTNESDKYLLYNIYASFHIWQAVPLFMLVFGFTFRLSIEKGHTPSHIVSSRTLRLIFPLIVAYVMSFILLLLFSITPEITWHNLIGKLPLYGHGTYFITLYLETILYFVLLYYIVITYNIFIVFLFSILFSVVGEFIAYYIDINDSFMYASSIHRYTLFVALGYYLYDFINEKRYKFIVFLGFLSGGEFICTI